MEGVLGGHGLAEARRETRFERMCRALTAPDMRKADDVQQREIAATIIFTLTGMTIFAAFALMVYRQGNYAAAQLHLGVFFAYGAGFLLVRLGVPTFAMYSNILATAVGIFGAMWFGGGIAAPAVVFLATLPTVGVLSLGRRAGIYGVVLGLAVIAGTVVLERMGFEPRLDSAETTYRKRVIECVVLLIEMYVLAIAFQRLADRAYGLLSEKRDELADLLNTMRQGLFTFDREGRIQGEHSLQAREIFGLEDLQGQSVLELLFADAPAYDLEREAFESWLETAFQLGRRGWDELVDMAPSARTLHVGTDREQHLRLEIRPVFEEEDLARVMMLVTDETQEVMLRREVDENAAQRARSSARLRRLAAAGAHTFVAYLVSSRKRIGSMRDALTDERGLTRPVLQECFRHAHTVRGEARAFDMYELEEPMREVESILAESLRAADNDPEPLTGQRPRLQALLEQGAEVVDEAERRLVEVSPIGEAVLDQVTVSRRDLDALTRCVANASQHIKEGDEQRELESVARRLSARPMGELVAQFVDAVPRWAEERGKRIQFEIEGKRCMVEPALAAALPRALAHLLRNAVAHGIETPDERDQRGKPTRGVLKLIAQHRDGRLVIHVQDDGAGLDTDALKERAARLGVTEDSPQQLIFANGLSTSGAVDSLSGQGVGMGAARQALQEVGYVIEVSSSPGQGARFSIQPAESPPNVRQVS